MIDNKYNVDINKQEFSKNLYRLINQLWKLIPMREHEEDWKKQLDTVILEIVGCNELFLGRMFVQLISKLEGLRVQDTEFELYRKTVFECINLLQELIHDRL